MTVLGRGARTRRSGRRPGWVLLTVLLVLAILASSALVFTDRVELLKLAVILALWAAVVAAFVSVIYRRQSDVDQAKARDLKLVYDLQLDREISARREYELTVETHLRRELAAELRAQSADEVAALRAELAALRTNLEILFDADLSHRPAIETERTTVHAFSDWARDSETTGRVTSSRIDDFESAPHVRDEDRDEVDVRTEESPIIDVPAEPQPPENEWAPPGFGGAHRRPSEPEPVDEPRGRRYRAEEEPQQVAPPPGVYGPQPAPVWTPPPPPPPPPVAQPAPPPEPAPAPEPEPQEPEESGWHPVPAEGEWIPAGAPGSNWVAPVVENGSTPEYVGRRRAPESTPEPVMSSPPVETRSGRHSAGAEDDDSAPTETPPPVLATESGQPPPHPQEQPEQPEPEQPEPEAEPEEAEEAVGRRHRSVEDTGGQSVADLLARLQAAPSEGGRRRRREE